MSAPSLAAIRAALAVVPCPDAATWRKIGAATKGYGTDGFDAWAEWAAQTGFDRDDCRKAWGSLSRGDPKEVIILAQERGFQLPRAQLAPLPSTPSASSGVQVQAAEPAAAQQAGGQHELDQLSEYGFQVRWPQMPQEEKDALPADVRARCVTRFRRLTPNVGDSIRRLDAEQRKRAAAETAAAPEGPAAQLPSQLIGATLLKSIHAFLGRFVAYPSEHAHVAHVLWIAHAHMMDAWESTPRIAFLSPEPGSGKTRALEITETLTPRPAESVNATPAYLFRKISDQSGAPTILYDEIDTVFGPKAKENEEIRGILNAGHRRGAMAGRCVMRGRAVETEELPAYCAVAMAGLGRLPDTILSRSIVVRMRKRGPSEVVEAYRRRFHAPEGNELRDQLAAWAQAITPSARRALPEMPSGIEDRDADVWESLLVVADAAGGDWPDRARAAAVVLVADANQSTPSLGVRILADLRAIFGTREHMSTENIIAALVRLDEAPWSDMKGKPIDSRRLAGFLRQYGVRSRNVRIGDGVAKGYAAEDLHDPWSRYLQAASADSATSATSATPDETEVIA